MQAPLQLLSNQFDAPALHRVGTVPREHRQLAITEKGAPGVVHSAGLIMSCDA